MITLRLRWHSLRQYVQLPRPSLSRRTHLHILQANGLGGGATGKLSTKGHRMPLGARDHHTSWCKALQLTTSLSCVPGSAWTSTFFRLLLLKRTHVLNLLLLVTHINIWSLFGLLLFRYYCFLQRFAWPHDSCWRHHFKQAGVEASCFLFYYEGWNCGWQLQWMMRIFLPRNDIK